MNTEIQLFILWEKARDKEVELLDIIENKFEIIQTFSITWSPYNVGRNFTRFYGQSLPDNSQKELHCGSGEFKVIVVRDMKPNYQTRKTSKGNRTVNINMFDTKSKLREITGGGHKIHGTDNINETKHNIALIFGTSLDNFLNKYKTKVEDIKLKQDLVGTNGWNSFDELFTVLNQCSEYVVLRNYKNINLEYFQNNKGNIDILSKDMMETKFILGDLKNINNNHLKVDINKEVILFEVDCYNKNLFIKKWEDDIFESKIKTNNIYHPNEENEMYILIYHALFFKNKLENKHITRIYENYNNVFNNKENIEQDMITTIKKFFIEKEYKIVPPDDGYFNFRIEFNDFYKKNKKRKSKFSKYLNKIFNFSMKNKIISINLFTPIRRLFFTEILIPYVCTIKFKIGK